MTPNSTTVPIPAAVSPTAVQTVVIGAVPEASGSYFAVWDVGALWPSGLIATMRLQELSGDGVWTDLLVATDCVPGAADSQLPGRLWLGYTTDLASVGLQLRVQVTFGRALPIVLPAGILTVSPVVVLPTHQSIALTHHTSGSASATSLTVTITSTTANHLLLAGVFECGVSAAAGDLVSANLSETGGTDTWADCIAAGTSAAGGGAFGSYTVTAGGVTAVTFGPVGTTQALTMHVSEYSGAATASVLDQQQSMTKGGSNTDIQASASITPSVANCLVWSLALTTGLGGQNIAAGTNYMFLDFQSPADDSSSEYWVQTTATATAGDFTITNGHTASDWLVGLASFKPAGGATNYTLAMTAGSYSLTGDSVTPRIARLLALAAGSYALTGDAATLRVARLLALTAGAYSITGAPLTPRVARMLGLTAGSYALTGDALTPRTARMLALASGSYALTGAPATFVWTHGGVSYSLTLSPGSYALTGAGLTAPVAYAFVTSAGAYILSGEPATLEYLTPEVGGTGGPPPGTARRKYVIDTRAPLRRDDPDPRPQQRPALPGDPVFTDAPEPVFAPQRPVSPVDPVVVVLPPAGFVLEPGTAVDVHGADGRALQGMTAQRLKAARQRQTDADVLAELGELIYLLNLL